MSLSDRPKRLSGTESAASDAVVYRRDSTDRSAGLSSFARQEIPTKERKLAHPMLDELADLISQAWAEYESKIAPSALQDTFVQGEQGRHDKQPSLKVVSSTPLSSETRGTAIDNKAYHPSTQRIMRRIDALFTTEESSPSVVPAVSRQVGSDR